MAFSRSSYVSNCSTFCAVPAAKATARQVLLSLHYFYFSKISCTAAFYFFFFALVNWYLLALHVLVFHFLLQSTLLNLISVSHHFTAMERCQKDLMRNLRSVLECQKRWLIATKRIGVDTSFGSTIPKNY